MKLLINRENRAIKQQISDNTTIFVKNINQDNSRFCFQECIKDHWKISRAAKPKKG